MNKLKQMASSKKENERLGKTPEAAMGGGTPFEQSPEIASSLIGGPRQNFAVDMSAFNVLQQERSSKSPSALQEKPTLNPDIPRYQVNPEVAKDDGFFLTGIQVQGSQTIKEAPKPPSEIDTLEVIAVVDSHKVLTPD